MTNPFRARSPWLMAIVALIFGSFSALLLLNRGKLAWIVLLGSVAAWLGGALLLPNVIESGITPDTIWILNLPVLVVGVVLVSIAAMRRHADQTPQWYGSWYVFFLLIAVQVALVLAVRAWLFQPYYMPSESMEPTVSKNDFFWAEKFAYNNDGPNRGDVVLFRRNGAVWNKRVVGVPGDTVAMALGILHINGKAVERKYVGKVRVPQGFGPEKIGTMYRVTLPGGRSFQALDMMDDGILDNTQIFNIPAGKYFVIGDNLDNSDDSRSDVGFVSRDQIIGRATYIFVRHGRMTWDAVE